MTADLRLAAPALAGWAASGALIGMPETLLPVSAGCWAVAVILLAVALVVPAGRAVAVLLAVPLAAAALTTGSAAIGAQQRSAPALVAAAESRLAIEAEAVVTEAVTAGEGARFRARLTAASGIADGSAFEVPVLVFADEPVDPLGIGTVISLRGALQAAEAGDSVAYLLFARGAVTVVGEPPWLLDWANGLRARFAAAAQSTPGDGGDLLPGLAIGDTSRVSDGLDSAMKRTSLSHLTAVSGANCAVVVGLVLLAGGALGLSRLWRVLLSLAVLLAFVVLVTPEPSVLRAAVMAGLVLVAVAAGRPVRGIPVLCLAVLILLVADPWLSRSYGFVLSVLATAGLLLLAVPLARLLGRVLPPAIAMVVAVPLAAQLACQPVLILLDPAVPVYGVVANVLAEPAAPVATVLGLIACVLLPFAPWAGEAVVHIAWLPSAWIAAVARFLADLPGSRLPWLHGAAGMALLAGLTALLLFAALGRAGGRMRWAAGCAAAVVVLGLLAASAGSLVGRQLRMPQDWTIAACDVGQGDAVLVRSAGEVALVDTGPDAAALDECLDALGVGRIGLLVLSHYDMDHIGGTGAVLGRVDRVIAGPAEGERDERLLRSLAEAGAVVERAGRGLGGRLGELGWRVLWPPAGGDRDVGVVQPGNAASVTVEFRPLPGCRGGCLSSLFLGDLGRRAQELLLAGGLVRPVDVVKVAHHGSADQSERLYRAVAAAVGVIGVGADNRYGHPTERLLSLLAASGTTAERSDSQGMVLIAGSRAEGVEVWSERGGG